ncbi:MAG: gamma-glutamyltransferase [Halioglobus sp.]
MRKVFSFLGAVLFSASLLADAAPYAASSANGSGAVATVHPLATEAGLNALARGGNAIDAAVAAAFTLGVVDSHNSGIGGGNFGVIHWADGSVEAFDGREMAPAAAHRDMYLVDGKGDISLSMTGPLAVGIPGSLAVYQAMHKRAGEVSWKDLVLPAADLAERGFALNNAVAGRLAAKAEDLAKFPGSADILLDDKGQPWPAGHHLVQKDLANTYRQVAAKGGDYFYRGKFASAVAQWMKDNGGIITADDFANYQMKIREPVISQYRGHTVYGFPPPSAGGVNVAQMLNILEGFDVASLSEAQRYHLLAEAMKIAFADRAHFLGDPDFVPVPKGLIDPAYAAERAKLINLKRVAEGVSYGSPPRADVDLFGKHTTHLVTADKWGNWVSITTTVNTSFGSKIIVPGTGLVLNNQMDDFSTQPGVPNAFGLVGAEANSVAAGKRPLSSMSPTIIVRDGKPVMALGAAGGPTITTQVVQNIVNVIDLGMSAEQALATQRVHHQWAPDMLFAEKNMPVELQESLKAMGHNVNPRSWGGTSQMIRAKPGGGFEAASEPRVIARNAEASERMNDE